MWQSSASVCSSQFLQSMLEMTQFFWKRKNKKLLSDSTASSTFTTRKNEEEFPHKSAAVKSELDESLFHRDRQTRSCGHVVNPLHSQSGPHAFKHKSCLRLVLGLRVEPGLGLGCFLISTCPRLNMNSQQMQFYSLHNQGWIHRQHMMETVRKKKSFVRLHAGVEMKLRVKQWGLYVMVNECFNLFFTC